jgi:hypothetical protein
MPSVTGLGLTFNLPNYTGEILQVTPTETPFLSAIGGLNEQGEVVASTRFEAQTQDFATSFSQPAIVEGADAPTLTERTRQNWSNVVQIFHKAFGVSYTREATAQMLAGLATGGARNPVADELAYQQDIHLTELAREMNWTFINGSYQLPSDNTTGRRTRGLLEAISTNAMDNRGVTISATGEADDEVFTATAHGLTNGQRVIISGASLPTGITAGTYFVRDVTTNTFRLSATKGGAAVALSADGTADVRLYQPLTDTRVLDLMQMVWESHGINQAAEPTLMVNASLKRALTKLFITDKGYQEMSRSVAGVSVTTIQTDFGNVNIMVERAMPATTVVFAHLALIKPAYLLIPGKGFLFVEELAKTGAQSKYQIYGEAGLWHGPQQAHAKIEYAGEVVGA